MLPASGEGTTSEATAEGSDCEARAAHSPLRTPHTGTRLPSPSVCIPCHTTLRLSSANHIRVEADNRFGNANPQIWQQFFVNIAIAEISRLSESPLARLSRLA